MGETDTNRAQVLGQLIQNARERSGYTIEQTAELLGIATDDFAQIENAEQGISLPELEALALYFKVPMAYFWGSEDLTHKSEPDYQAYVLLRQRIIAVLLRNAREGEGLSVEQLASDLDADPEEVTAYESGYKPIPYFQLEKIAGALNIDVQKFAQEEQGPLAREETQRLMLKRFRELPPDVQAFVVEPINLSYLETAMRLSQMDVDKLRSIAEGILDITF